MCVRVRVCNIYSFMKHGPSCQIVQIQILASKHSYSVIFGNHNLLSLLEFQFPHETRTWHIIIMNFATWWYSQTLTLLHMRRGIPWDDFWISDSLFHRFIEQQWKVLTHSWSRTSTISWNMKIIERQNEFLSLLCICFLLSTIS